MFINYSSQMLVYPADWKDPASVSSSSLMVTLLPSSVIEPAMIDIISTATTSIVGGGIVLLFHNLSISFR